jgi:hypothetical protein
MCSDMIQHQVKPAIRRKRRGLSSSDVHLQHHNSRPHTEADSGFRRCYPIRHIRQIWHPVIFTSFGPWKTVRKRRFRSYEGVKEAVHYWLVHQPKDFLCQGLCALVEIWRRRVERGRGMHGRLMWLYYICFCSISLCVTLQVFIRMALVISSILIQ